jgi:hydroxymethylglutaryl-CoA lyase
MSMPERVTICEVGTRDGFQIEPEFIATETKIDMVNRLTAAGLPRIEVTSFVHPKVVPQMRDAAEVMAGIERRPGTVYAALIPNEKGAVRAIEAGVDKLHTVLSASESHNLANVNMTVAESLDKLAAVAPVARDAGIPVQGGISTVFGCPFEGRIPLKKLESIAVRLVDLGFQGISLADTTGMANPAQVQRILEYLMPKFPGIEWNLHTHNTRGMAISNILAAMSCGVQSFDSSVAGLGGCPFAPGATGNVCTEDLVHCLHAMDVETGIDLDELVAAAQRLEAVIGRPLPGQVMKAGSWDRRYAVPHAVEERLAAL